MNFDLGLLIWQFNEVWPTGGWGLIEYGRKTDDGSQIFGGRWKVSLFLFRDIYLLQGTTTHYFQSE